MTVHASGELLTPTAYAKRAHVDRRTVLRWCREDPLFPAVRIDPWPGVTQPRYRIAVDGIANWVAARRQTDYHQLADNTEIQR